MLSIQACHNSRRPYTRPSCRPHHQFQQPMFFVPCRMRLQILPQHGLSLRRGRTISWLNRLVCLTMSTTASIQWHTTTARPRVLTVPMVTLVVEVSVNSNDEFLAREGLRLTSQKQGQILWGLIYTTTSFNISLVISRILRMCADSFYLISRTINHIHFAAIR
jgi:hypothetical protein